MTDLDLTPDQLDRYSRHIFLDDVGTAGQAALLDATVLVVGAGGLGSPIIQYLAAAGVGTLGIIDDDVVERSNLQRQIIHREADVGRPKVTSAAEYVEHLNPDVTLETYDERLTPETVEDRIASYDFVVDGSDNFETRYLVNDACTLAGIPFSHGAIFRFEGQVTTFPHGDGSPCYRCLFPEAPPPGTVPDCSTAGVLGVLPGTIGCIQATETIKAIMETGELLDGRLLFYDALDLTFETVEIRGRTDCALCGEDPTITAVEDVEYSGSCTVTASDAQERVEAGD